MKKCVVLLTIVALLGGVRRCAAQEAEIEQLLLNIEKLAQLKTMLEDLKKGYEIVFSGYTTIKNISEGTFNLHQAFLDGLLEVSPAVRDYYKVSQIIQNAASLAKEYSAALRAFRSSSLLTRDELLHIENVYDNLFSNSLEQLQSLALVLTPGSLRMADDERLSVIDSIDEALKDKRAFLRHFTNSGKLLLLQRAKEINDINSSKKLNGVTD